MARTVAEIKKEISDKFITNETIIRLYGIDTSRTFEQQFSAVSLESILFYVVAFSIWFVENLFDVHRAEVQTIISTMKPHTARWYAEKSRVFQFGFDLQPDSDQFDNTGRTEAEIAVSKIIEYAAVIEQDNQIRIKVAKIAGNDLAPLTVPELSAFSSYINRVKDAGIAIELLTDDAEQLRLGLTIFYNPLVIGSDGKRIDGTSDTPVPDAVRNYLANIEFDGTFVIAHLVDDLQSVEGVVIPHVVLCQYKYGVLDWIDIDVYRRPLSGYMRISDNNLLITYTPRNT